MNNERPNENRLYVQVLAGSSAASEPSLVGIDRRGMAFRVRTPAGRFLGRGNFPEVILKADQVRSSIDERIEATRVASR